MKEIKPCPLCKTKCEVYSIAPLNQLFTIKCPSCGKYNLTDMAIQVLDKRKDSFHIISGITRNFCELHKDTDSLFVIKGDVIDDDAKFQAEFISKAPKSVTEKALLLLQYIYRKSNYPGDKVLVKPSQDYPICFCKNAKELIFYINHIKDSGDIKADGTMRDYTLYLTAKGWEKVENLQQTNGIHHSSNGGGNDVEAAIGEALKAFENSEFDRAIELCDKALSINPNHIKAMDIRGTSYSRLGKYDEAIEQFDIILQKEPKNIDALKGKGLAFLKKNDYDATYDTFELLTKIEPDNIIAWHSMGEALFYKDSFDEAIKCLDKAIKINPNNDSSWVMKAKALSKKGEKESAINCFDEALKYAANKSYILLKKGIAYGEMGDKDEEFRCYDQAIENDPKYIQVYMQKAHVLTRHKDYDGAIECFKKGIDNDLEPEKEAVLWHNLASAYLWVKNYQEAYKSINRSLELHDNEFTREVREAIKKDMASKGAGDDDFENVFRDNLITFLITEKMFPRESLNYGIVAEVPDLDLVADHPDTDDSLAVFNCKSGHYGKPSQEVSESIAKDYKSGLVGIQNPFVYIVYPSEQSNEDFVIYEVEDDGTSNEISYEDFPVYGQLLFESPLSAAGRRIYRELIRLAKDKHGFRVHTPCRDYIDLQIKKNKRTAAQIHRLNNSDDNISLVLAGYQKYFPEPKLPNYMFEGELKQLSGYTSKSSKEKNWLEGNLGHQRLKYEAGVYILKRGALFFDEIKREVGGLLELAKKNAEGSKKPDKAQTIGGVATMADDKVTAKDLLGRSGLVEALANMFVHSKEMEGFTVALFGNWGAGKSTVMNLLTKRLNEKKPRYFDFVIFNAWGYEQTENIAAGLAQEVVRGLIGNLKFMERQKLRFYFAIQEYGKNILRIICYVLFAIVFLCLFDKIGGEGDWKNYGLAGGWIAIVIFVFINIAKIIEHPITVKLETYLKLPNYNKHLGLIPILRRHIDTLCGLRLRRTDIRMKRTLQISTIRMLDRISRSKRKILWPFGLVAKCLKFLFHKWWLKTKKTRVEMGQLVLFVDDLDRCQPKCIAETLDAIRLVMSVPRVNVFICIDHRIAFKAIGEHYQKVSDGNGGRRKGEIARDYLGKIIQLPIRLQEPTVQGLKGFINERLFPSIVHSPLKSEQKEKGPAIPQPSVDIEGGGLGDTGRDRITTDEPPEQVSTVDMEETPTETEITEEEMRDTEQERDEFYEMAKTFRFSNPRQLLRLRNCYRLIKALELQKNREAEFEKLKGFMRMLFWQEFLHSREKELREACVKVLYDGVDAEEISDEQAKAIVKQVKDLMLESFADKRIYDETAEDVRIVVLPHSQED